VRIATMVVRRAARAAEGGGEVGQASHPFRLGAEAAGVGGEVHAGQGLVLGVAQQVVEALAARGALQAVDAAVTAVVEHDDDQLAPEHHRGRDLGVEHQVGAVADEDEHLAGRFSHLHAEAARDLVTHAGEAVFHVVAAGLGGLPVLVQLAR
jgi:hypothetical protein